MNSKRVLSCSDLLGHVHHAMLVLDEIGTVLQQEGRLPELLGYGDDDLTGRNALEFVAPQHHEVVAFVFAGNGYAVERSWFQPFSLGLLARSGDVHDVECEAQSLTVEEQRVWLVTLRSHRLQSSSYRAMQALHADASGLEVASIVSDSLSDDWVEEPQISSFVVSDHDAARFTTVAHHARTAPTALVDAFESAVAGDAPWNHHGGGSHFTASLGELPDHLATVAAAEGFVIVNIAVARFDDRPSIGLVSFGRHDLAFAGNIDRILRESLGIVEMTMRREQSDEDPLTGLSNRTRFIAAIERHESDTAVLYIDLDDFKQVNDTYGHSIGDAVLVETARRIASVCRPADVVARLGGDEFAVLLADVERDVAVEISQRILDAIRAPMALGTGPGSIRASAGLAMRSPGCTDPIDRADLAMLDGKREGRGQLVVAGS